MAAHVQGNDMLGGATALRIPDFERLADLDRIEYTVR